MEPKKFANLYTSRTIKPTGLSNEDIDRAVQMGKFEPCEVPIQDNKLPRDVHGVNTFAMPELKGRRRLITEPHLEARGSTCHVPVPPEPALVAALRQVHAPDRLRGVLRLHPAAGVPEK
eukprot:gene6775-biopygen4611